MIEALIEQLARRAATHPEQLCLLLSEQTGRDPMDIWRTALLRTGNQPIDASVDRPADAKEPMRVQ
mgnify:CR=1 FL=1